MGLDDSRKWGYDSFRMYVPILSKRMCVYLSKKAVAIETSCVYSVVYAFLSLWKKSVDLLVMSYKFLHCEEIPRCRKITVSYQITVNYQITARYQITVSYQITLSYQITVSYQILHITFDSVKSKYEIDNVEIGRKRAY